tara:strand:- start:708 stop:1598 length:891 start_codon:yes stop_codon:yes gene_type:complete
MDDYLHEYSVKIGKSTKKVDMAITLSGSQPDMLIECKPTNRDVSKDFGQLNEYCLYNKEVKVGILTNGVIYKFYSRSEDPNEILHKDPFFEFDLTSYNDSDIENLSSFFRKTINLSHILDNANETYFIDRFNSALFNLLSEPNEELIKLINHKMGGKRTSPKISDKIFKLINSISIEQVLDNLKSKESKNASKGIVTTSDEIKAYNVIKTIMAMSSKFNNNELDRIVYKDFKGSFKLLVDGKQTKCICSLVMENYKKTIEININGENVKYEIEDVSASTLTKYKKELVESALANLI